MKRRKRNRRCLAGEEKKTGLFIDFVHWAILLKSATVRSGIINVNEIKVMKLLPT